MIKTNKKNIKNSFQVKTNYLSIKLNNFLYYYSTLIAKSLFYIYFNDRLSIAELLFWIFENSEYAAHIIQILTDSIICKYSTLH